MDKYLLKKEKDQNGSKYFDIFATFDQNLEQPVANPRNKDNAQSTASRKQGNELFRVNNYSDALELYNISLCFAELGSENVALAYSNRSACFFHMNKYERSLIDIELAKNANLPSNLILKLDERKKQCLKELAEMNQPSKYAPKLSYEADEKFPCLANVVEIKYNTEFGRHLVATADIPVGKIVSLEEIFIKTRERDTTCACYTCFREKVNFIVCQQCPDVLFCNADCMNRNQRHKLECGFFTARVKADLRLIHQSILLAMETFGDAESLMKFVENILREDQGKLPASLHDSQSKYHLFFKLYTSNRLTFEMLRLSFAIYTDARRVPTIRSFFNGDDKKRFFMHLIAHHLLIIKTNAMVSPCTSSITNVVCLLNHSCAPNIGTNYFSFH